jgi:hypothetical protein
MCTVAPDPVFLQGRALVRHVSYMSGSYLPVGEGSGVPRVLHLRILPPCRGGLRCAMCLTALDPASLEGRAPERRMSYGSRPCLPIERALVPPLHALRFPVDHGPQT